MNTLVVFLRLVHIFSGVLWVGFALFGAFILGPALDRLGQDAGKVMGAIGPSFNTKVMPLIAVLTLVSGFWLYWIMSGGLAPTYIHSRMGMTLALGGLAALTAFLVGLIFIRPTMTRAMGLQQGIAAAPAEQKAAMAAEAQQLRNRALRWGKGATALLVLATLCMAVGRYL